MKISTKRLYKWYTTSLKHLTNNSAFTKYNINLFALFTTSDAPGTSNTVSETPIQQKEELTLKSEDSTTKLTDSAQQKQSTVDTGLPSSTVEALDLSNWQAR